MRVRRLTKLCFSAQILQRILFLETKKKIDKKNDFTCLSVRLYTINVKTAETIGPKAGLCRTLSCEERKSLKIGYF